MKHIGTKTLETDRLVLRRIVKDDAELMFCNWANDHEVTRYLTWQAHASVNDTKEIIDLWLSEYDKPDYYLWCIVVKETGEPIGSIAAVGINEAVKSAEIGYCIGKRWWRQGYTTEALEAVIRFFFEEVGLNRIEAGHDPNNPNSGKVMQKAGLQYEGTLRQARKNNQGICDYSICAILAEDYFAPKMTDNISDIRQAKYAITNSHIK